MQRRLPAVIMRGGSSRAIFFHAHHLPRNQTSRDAILLAVLGSPDPTRRQIDGLGGGVSSTSKVALISHSGSRDYDVAYCFGQVGIDQPYVDYKANCGNIIGAVGPFAVDEGLVPVIEPMTPVRIYQVNTDKIVIADVPVKAGRFDETGGYVMAGVQGSGSRIGVRFIDPGGGVTGALLPTGRPQDLMKQVAGIGDIAVSIVDAANPIVFVRASDLGIKGSEIDLFDRHDMAVRLEAIRAHAAVLVGLAKSAEEASISCQAVPKIVVVSPAQSYSDIEGNQLHEHAMDLCARAISMGTLNKSMPATAAICANGAARIPGSLVSTCIRRETIDNSLLRVGHPSGIMEVAGTVEVRGDSVHYSEATVYRTARRLMEGYVLVPERLFSLTI